MSQVVVIWRQANAFHNHDDSIIDIIVHMRDELGWIPKRIHIATHCLERSHMVRYLIQLLN